MKEEIYECISCESQFETYHSEEDAVVRYCVFCGEQLINELDFD